MYVPRRPHIHPALCTIGAISSKYDNLRSWTAMGGNGIRAASARSDDRQLYTWNLASFTNPRKKTAWNSNRHYLPVFKYFNTTICAHPNCLGCTAAAHYFHSIEDYQEWHYFRAGVLLTCFQWLHRATVSRGDEFTQVTLVTEELSVMEMNMSADEACLRAFLSSLPRLLLLR